MGVLIKSRDQIQGEILDRLRESGLLTNLSAGRAAFILSQIHSDQLAEVYQAVEANNSLGFIASSSGPFLDLIAEPMGIFRLPQQAGITLAEEQNIRFFVTSGTLASHIPGKIIPVGTTITTDTGTPVYQILEDVIFNDVATEVFASAVSEDVGPDQNVGKGELTSHSLGLADVLVINQAAITSAADYESDEQLRARLSDAWLARATANMSSIREAINVVPGVSEVRLVPFRNGPGTVQATIIPTSTTINPRLIPLAANNLEQIRGGGTIIDLAGPRFVDVAITIILQFREDTPEGQKAGIRQQAAQELLDYIGSIRLGGDFLTQQMTRRVLDVSNQILQFETRCFEFRGRTQTFRNFTPDPDELLRPDPTVEQPIRVL